MKFLAIALVGALALPGIVSAQTCASPLPIGSNQTLNGTTCGGTAGLNLGGTVYPHTSVVYSFVAQNAAGNVTITGAQREVALTPNCNTAPIRAGAPGIPMDVSGLVNGQTYLIVVSTDPSEPPAPPLCGAYGLNTPTLPVALQNFSVE